MSATIQEYNSDEEFDDDTDLPLPSAPPPNARSAVAHAAPQPSSSSSSSGPPPSTGNAMMDQLASMMGAMGGDNDDPRFRQDPSIQTVEDVTPYRNWHPIYPIYLDAKRAYGPKGGRRIARDQAHWWPLSKDICLALQQLGMPVFHEVTKSHPKDWANPGRVKTEFQKEGGEWINEKIKNRKQLYTQVSLVMHRLSRSSLPRPTNLPPLVKPSSSTSSPPTTNPTASSSLATPPPKSHTKRPHPHSTLLPHAPKPLPPLSARYSEYSPAIPGGSFVRALQGERERELKAKEEAKKARLEAGGKEEAVVGQIEGGEAGGEKKVKKEKKEKVKMVRQGKR